MGSLVSKRRKKRTFIPRAFRPVLKGEKLLPEGTKDGQCKAPPSKQHKKEQRPIIIGVRDDASQTATIRMYRQDGDLEILYFDQLGVDWSFSFFDNQLTFYSGSRVIEPLGIYIRPFCPPPGASNRELCLHLIHAVELWEGKVIGARLDNTFNGSKVYQLLATIHPAMRDASEEKFKIPASYFIKGSSDRLHQLLKQHGSLIVKSCSGIRSRVVDEQDFLQWDLSRLSFLPTLFQERVEGIDVRVHVLREHLWAVQVPGKEGVDYRYVPISAPYAYYALSESQRNFCLRLRQKELLLLVGIDLIVSKKGIYCLECNPSPGFAGFHRNCGDEAALTNTLCKEIGCL